MKLASFFILLVALLNTGCPGPDQGGPPADALLTTADGSYAGEVTETISTANDQAAALPAIHAREVIADIADGQITLLRFGLGTFGVFTSWQTSEGNGAETEVALGDGSVRVVRTIQTPGASVLGYQVEASREDADGTSTGHGEGLLLVVVDGESLHFTLDEQVRYETGPASGEVQTIHVEGTLSKVQDVPAPVPPDDGGASGEPPVPPTQDEPAAFDNAGTETLPDGTTRTYSGNREVAPLDEPVETSPGQTYNVVSETLVRTFVNDEGQSTTETDDTRVYFNYDENGMGRIFGYQENGVNRFIVDPAEGVSGALDALEVGATRSYTATFDDGTVDEFSETITGTSQVILPTGAFNVFISESRLERTRPDGTVETAQITAYIEPMQGMLYRRVTGSIRNPDASVKTTEFEEFLGNGS